MPLFRLEAEAPHSTDDVEVIRWQEEVLKFFRGAKPKMDPRLVESGLGTPSVYLRPSSQVNAPVILHEGAIAPMLDNLRDKKPPFRHVVFEKPRLPSVVKRAFANAAVVFSAGIHH
jgi:hypothetical protein